MFRLFVSFACLFVSKVFFLKIRHVSFLCFVCLLVCFKSFFCLKIRHVPFVCFVCLLVCFKRSMVLIWTCGVVVDGFSREKHKTHFFWGCQLSGMR